MRDNMTNTNTSHGLADSGNRTDPAGTGALRDRPEGKGRCDLLPLETTGLFLEAAEYQDVFARLKRYIYEGDSDLLIEAAQIFAGLAWESRYEAALELSKHYEAGAVKYAPRNWEKGLPLSDYINSGVRHLIKHLHGLKDEPHNRACLWNIFCAHWTHVNKPELIDLPFASKPE